MEFFSQLSELIDGYTITMTIKKDKERIIVMIVPKLNVKKDDVQKEIIPLTISGTADELDRAFFLSINEGLKKTKGIQSNIEEFEASLGKAEKKATKPKVDSKASKPVIKKDEEKLKVEEEKSAKESKESTGNSFKPGKAPKEKPAEKITPEPEPEPNPIVESSHSDINDDEDW